MAWQSMVSPQKTLIGEFNFNMKRQLLVLFLFFAFVSIPRAIAADWGLFFLALGDEHLLSCEKDLVRSTSQFYPTQDSLQQPLSFSSWQLPLAGQPSSQTQLTQLALQFNVAVIGTASSPSQQSQAHSHIYVRGAHNDQLRFFVALKQQGWALISFHDILEHQIRDDGTVVELTTEQNPTGSSFNRQYKLFWFNSTEAHQGENDVESAARRQKAVDLLVRMNPGEGNILLLAEHYVDNPDLKKVKNQKASWPAFVPMMMVDGATYTKLKSRVNSAKPMIVLVDQNFKNRTEFLKLSRRIALDQAVILVSTQDGRRYLIPPELLQQDNPTAEALNLIHKMQRLEVELAQAAPRSQLQAAPVIDLNKPKFLELTVAAGLEHVRTQRGHAKDKLLILRNTKRTLGVLLHRQLLSMHSAEFNSQIIHQALLQTQGSSPLIQALSQNSALGPLKEIPKAVATAFNLKDLLQNTKHEQAAKLFQSINAEARGGKDVFFSAERSPLIDYIEWIFIPFEPARPAETSHASDLDDVVNLLAVMERFSQEFPQRKIDLNLNHHRHFFESLVERFERLNEEDKDRLSQTLDPLWIDLWLEDGATHQPQEFKPTIQAVQRVLERLERPLMATAPAEEPSCTTEPDQTKGACLVEDIQTVEELVQWVESSINPTSKFKIQFSPQALKALGDISKNSSLSSRWKKFQKSLRFLSQNPSHPGLRTKLFFMSGPLGELLLDWSGGLKVFESYLERYTARAYRFWWTYPEQGHSIIKIIWISPHPDGRSS